MQRNIYINIRGADKQERGRWIVLNKQAAVNWHAVTFPDKKEAKTSSDTNQMVTNNTKNRETIFFQAHIIRLTGMWVPNSQNDYKKNLRMCLMELGPLVADFHYRLSWTAKHIRHHHDAWPMHYRGHLKRSLRDCGKRYPHTSRCG